MDDRKLKLVKEAGFICWEDEEWGPGSGYVDWGSEYDNELDKLIDLVVLECAQVVRNAEPHLVADLVKAHFGLNGK